MPVLSGVAPSKRCCQAYMDLQMCTPLSFTSVALITSLPAALSSSDTENPSRLLRTCPRCRGLLVLGDENSTIILFPVGGSWPKDGSEAACSRASFQ